MANEMRNQKNYRQYQGGINWEIRTCSCSYVYGSNVENPWRRSFFRVYIPLDEMQMFSCFY